MSELVIEHGPHHADRLLVARIRIPGDQRVHELAERAGRVPLPVGPLQGLCIEDGIDQIDLQAALGIVGDLVLHEIPGQMEDLVVSQVSLRVMPGQQLPLRIQDRFMPRESELT